MGKLTVTSDTNNEKYMVFLKIYNIYTFHLSNFKSLAYFYQQDDTFKISSY